MSPDELHDGGDGPLTFRLFYEYMEERDKKLDARYAAKWVERAVWAAGIAAAGSVVYALMGHIIVAR